MKISQLNAFALALLFAMSAFAQSQPPPSQPTGPAHPPPKIGKAADEEPPEEEFPTPIPRPNRPSAPVPAPPTTTTPDANATPATLEKPATSAPAGTPPATAVAVGAWFPEQLINRKLPYGLRVTLNGYLRAPLRLSWRDRGEGRKEGEASHDIRAPWLVDDDYFRSGFAYTRLQEQDWTELYLGVGNKWLSGTVALMGNLYSDWAKPIIDRQFGITQGWVTFNFEKATRLFDFRLRVKAGAFWDRFGYLPYYDTYLIGRTHQMGGQVMAEFKARRVTVWALYGLGAHLDAIESNQGFTLLNYLAVGARDPGAGKWEATFYFMDALTQDKRQLKELTDGDMKVAGADGRFNTKRFGRFYLGASLVDTVHGTYLSPAIEVMHAYGGRGLSENYFGTESSEQGTGRLYNVAFQHTYSLTDLMRVSGRQFVPKLRGMDLALSWFGVYTYTLSKQFSDDPAINRNGRALFKWGGELAWSALSWLALSMRYDRVILDMSDDANSFRMLTPRITFRIHWLVDAEIYLQYSRYWYGDRVNLRPGQIPLETKPDADVFKLQAQIIF